MVHLVGYKIGLSASQKKPSQSEGKICFAHQLWQVGPTALDIHKHKLFSSWLQLLLAATSTLIEKVQPFLQSHLVRESKSFYILANFWHKLAVLTIFFLCEKECENKLETKLC